MSNLSPYEQYLLELINRARSDPGAEAARLGISLNQGLSPGSITDDAKQPLAATDILNAAAADHSRWMLREDEFSHTGAGGSSAGDRIEAAGYDNWRTWGENLSYRGGGNVRTVDVVEGHHDGLFRSPGHRRNLMNDRFSEIGIGQEYGEFRGVNASMVTQKFASDFGDPFLVGVVYDDRDGDGFFDPGEELSGVRVTVSGEGSATTGPGGGYELRVDGGETYTVTFSGGELGRTISRTVRVDDENEKLDLIASPGGTGGGGSGGGASGDAEPESRVVEGDAGDDVVRTGGGDDTVSGRLGVTGSAAP
ncbi:MAG: CAP domain-containing protein [Pseudomonadota bacterium]